MLDVDVMLVSLNDPARSEFLSFAPTFRTAVKLGGYRPGSGNPSTVSTEFS